MENRTSRKKILLVSPRGFCAGVSRAIQIVELVLNRFENESVYVLHEVVHNKHVVDEKVVRNAANYMIAYAFIVIISMILISLDGFDVETNLSAVMATFNNVGPGLAAVGPVCNFSGFSGFSKLVLIFDMLAGRLEIFPIAILFSKSTWRKQ